MTKRVKRTLSVSLALLLLVLFVLTSAFLLCEADHDCIGEGCPICAAVQQLRNRFAPLLAVFALLSGLLLLCRLFRAVCRQIKNALPVTQRVRLNR